MKFTFPKNYKFSSKLFGFINYSNALLIAVWGIILFFISNLIFTSLHNKISFFIIFFMPIFLLVLINDSNENILFKIFYTIKFIKNRDYYLYSKLVYDKKNKKTTNILIKYLVKLYHNIL